MYSSHRPWRRAAAVVITALLLFFVVRDPARAADLTTRAAAGLGVVAESLVTFLGSF
ncbi:hypothetical protein ABZ470_00545 [Streptosporangium sp. NPDC020072]|uniref:hypothetical protein n=1 Tax=Streptosporangium sp. NPDC020072 TaxID=3154788 RepID=UPI0034291AC4